MNALSLISGDIVPLRTSSTGAEALEMMNDFHLEHLPIVNDKQLLGLLSEEDILNHDVAEAVGSYHLSLTNNAVAFENDHVFDVLARMANSDLSAISVVDQNENFLGVVSRQSLMQFFSRSFSFAEKGSILVLEMSKPDYAMSEISRVIESEQVAILSSFITEDILSNQILVHIKLNNVDIQRVVAALERYNYVIKAMFTQDDSVDMYKDRYASFMHYLRM